VITIQEVVVCWRRYRDRINKLKDEIATEEQS
jgi:hypothetical protein